MWCLLWLVFVGLHSAMAANLALPPAIQCHYGNGTSCTVQNYQGTWVDRKACKAAIAVYPTSESELFEAVALASKTLSKVKVVGSSHSYSKLVCPGGLDGVLISTQHLNSLIQVNLSSLTVTAHAGVLLRDLIDRIAEFGLALPHSPVWHGVSVAGMISTGAHGSGMWGRGSAPHDYVVGMRLIVPAAEEEKGFAKIVDLSEGDEDLNAAKLSVGVLGAISQVTFQLEPMFKRSARLEIREDTQLDGDGILKFAQEHEFGEICWYPFSGKALFKVEERVDVDSVGDGAYNMATLDKMDVEYIESLRRGLEAAEEGRSLGELCQEESKIMNLRHSSGDGFVNYGNAFTGYPVVGLNHKMQTSGGCEKEDVLPIITATGIDFNPTQHHTDLEDEFVQQDERIPLERNEDRHETCLWNPAIQGFFYFDTAISVPVSSSVEAIAEIKRLRDMNPEAMCSLAYIGGIWIRFLSASEAYLAGPTESIMFELMYFRARDAFTPRLHQDLFEEIEQMLVDKFGGRPHWGKNRELTFNNMHPRTVAMTKFLEVRQRFDPLGLFSSEWSDAVLGIESASSPRGVQTYEEHCALEGLCICKEDYHCHPAKGYFCKPGLAYKEARVCRYEKQDSSN